MYLYSGIDPLLCLEKSVLESSTNNCIFSLSSRSKTNDFDNIKSILHTLKGNAGTLGIERIAKLAVKIESDLKNNMYDETEKDLEELREKFEEFKVYYPKFLTQQ